MTPAILVLGGTAEAVWLAEKLTAHASVIYALAGRTTDPVRPKDATVRVGGFDGQAGLVRTLTEHRITLVVDATHPNARQITAHARSACGEVGVDYQQFRRRPWPSMPGDRWRRFVTPHQVADALIADPRPALVTLGRQIARYAAERRAVGHGVRNASDSRNALTPLLAQTAAPLLVRTIEPLDVPPPHRTIALRPPYTLEIERTLIDHHGLGCLVTRDSGGARPAKLDAFAEAGRDVFLLEGTDLDPAAESREIFYQRLAERFRL